MISFRYGYCAVFCLLLMLFTGCPDEECYENPNLYVPNYVGNIKIADSPMPTYIGQNFYYYGTPVGAFGNSVNEFFSVTKFDPTSPVGKTAFYWNVQTPLPFNPLQIGDTVYVYKLVQNQKIGDLNCIFAKAERVKSIVDVKVRTEGGVIVAEQRVTQTQYNVPAGQYAIFDWPIVYQGPQQYNINVQFNSDGTMVEYDTTDNNYTDTYSNFGL